MQSVGIRTQDYDVRYDETVRREVINKLTKMVNDPKFGEQYTVNDGIVSYHSCYWVNSNISNKNVFMLFLYETMDNTHGIFVPGITPLLDNDELISGFHFRDWEATHICSKLKEWVKIQKEQDKQNETVAKELRANEARKAVLETLANIR